MPVFMLLLLVTFAAWWFRHLWARPVIEWVRDVARPVVAPPRDRSVPALQRLVLRRIKTSLPLTVRGRVQIPSAVRVRVAPVDRQRIRLVETVFVDELAASLLEAAVEHDWVVAGTPTIEFVADDRATAGQPRIEIVNTVTSGTTVHDTARGTMPQAGLTMPAAGGRTRPSVAGSAELVSLDTRSAIPLRGATRVGRSVKSEGRIDSPGVSATHATILHEDGRWLLRDEGSTNGSWVNGKRVSSVELIAGDELEFGLDGPRYLFTVGGPNGTVPR